MTPRAAARRIAALRREALPEVREKSITERVHELQAETLELQEMIAGKRPLRSHKGRPISVAIAKRRLSKILKATGQLLSVSTP